MLTYLHFISVLIRTHLALANHKIPSLVLKQGFFTDKDQQALPQCSHFMHMLKLDLYSVHLFLSTVK